MISTNQRLAIYFIFLFYVRDFKLAHVFRVIRSLKMVLSTCYSHVAYLYCTNLYSYLEQSLPRVREQMKHRHRQELAQDLHVCQLNMRGRAFISNAPDYSEQDFGNRTRRILARFVDIVTLYSFSLGRPHALAEVATAPVVTLRGPEPRVIFRTFR